MKNETEKPLAQRITQGPITTEEGFIQGLFSDGERHDICDPRCAPPDTCCDEMDANTSLIEQAFNVTRETGKTPAQLAAENTKLREVLAELVAVHDLDTFRTRKVMPMDTPLAAAAIAKARELIEP